MLVGTVAAVGACMAIPSGSDEPTRTTTPSTAPVVSERDIENAALELVWVGLATEDEALLCGAWVNPDISRSTLLDSFFAGLNDPNSFSRGTVDQFIDRKCDP